MRPKKHILIAGADETRVSVLRYLLLTHGYAVTAAASAAEALEYLAGRKYAVLLCDWPLPGIEHLVDQADLRYREMPSLVLASSLTQRPESCWSSAVLTKGFTAADLIERIKIFASRKCGPKKGKPVASVPPAAADAADRRLA